jgi:glycosyltransferase involved in cell wall biosynthesis
MNPEVSIIIPTHNRLYNLKEAVDSIHKQTLKNYEIIRVDDASTDGTNEWVRSRCSDAKIIQLKENRGAAGARNEALKVATGEYIAFLDSDDIWLPEYLEAQTSSLKKNPKAVISICDAYDVKRGRRRLHKADIFSQGKDPILVLLLMESILTISCVVVNNKGMLDGSLMNETLRICEDREWYLRILLKSGGTVVRVPTPLVERRIMKEGLTRSHMRWWARDAQKLLKLFYSQKGSNKYLSIKKEAEAFWRLHIADAITRRHNKKLAPSVYFLRFIALVCSPSFFIKHYGLDKALAALTKKVLKLLNLASK